METNRSWSIDDRRYHFQFSTEIGWEIKGGKKGRMIKNPSYSGITTEFWNSCDAICSRDHWTLWGTPNCGKGQPCKPWAPAMAPRPRASATSKWESRSPNDGSETKSSRKATAAAQSTAPRQLARRVSATRTCRERLLRLRRSNCVASRESSEAQRRRRDRSRNRLGRRRAHALRQ